VGAVRKLATVVIVGLVALSTLMVVYLAAEPDRRGNETSEQESTMLVRGTELYITYCLQCHGPAGFGSAGRDGRIGGILNQDGLYSEEEQTVMVEEGDLNANLQSDDPVARSVTEDWIRFRIAYGVPPDPIAEAKVMPAFANDLNVEEMNALVYLIMDGDWNYVYNTIVRETGVHVAEEECLENPDAEYCDDVSQAPPVYPTAPPAGGNPNAESEEGATPEASDEGASDGATASEGDAAGASESGQAAVTLEAQDIAWSQTELTVKPGDTIEMTNTGQLPHDFTVDELGIQEATPTNGDTVTITIPEDAEAGEFEFYCSVPGHKEAGMVGTLIIEAP
jgi:plastocyanin/mono/diheme cytochrome c family protein